MTADAMIDKRYELGSAPGFGDRLMIPDVAVRETGATRLDKSIETDSVTFSWRHADSRLLGEVTAPTLGWLAAGFNSAARLRGTRFIIAAVSDTFQRFEEHITLVPSHHSVEVLGLTPSLADTCGTVERHHSTVRFSFPHEFPDGPPLRLAPGTRVHVMLAWSHNSDFGHHSAWRRHFDVEL